MLGLCDPGDEVVALDPFYDSYRAGAALAGARLVGVPLHPPDWRFDPAELAAAVTGRTRVLLLNTPHNPTGRVLDGSELEALAAVCREHDLIAISDEVYEHLVYEGEHVPLATLPGMAERTLTVSSIGKTFSVTGWKTGWGCGPAELVAAVRGAKQFMTFAGGTPLQHAAAARSRSQRSTARAWPPSWRPSATVCAPGSSGRAPRCCARPGRTSSTPTCARSGGTTASRSAATSPSARASSRSPPRCSAAEPERVRSLVRFAFCKREETIDEAARRLATLR